MEQQQNLTAAQRLERLEQSVFTVDQALGGIGEMTNILRQATRLMGRKLDAVVSLAEKGLPINNDSINQVMEDQTLQELKDMVAELKSTNTLEDAEEITLESFVVARETNLETGKVTKARIQFPILDVSEDIQGKLVGLKAGSVVQLDSNPFNVEILEVYKIVTPQPEVTAEQETIT